LEAATVSEILGIARFVFHEGKVEEFKRLSAECMEIVRTRDTGTLQYDIYFNEDQSECIVLERYRDSAALIEHATNVGHLMEAIVATGTVSGEILGEPGAAGFERATYARNGAHQGGLPVSALDPVSDGPRRRGRAPVTSRSVTPTGSTEPSPGAQTVHCGSATGQRAGPGDRESWTFGLEPVVLLRRGRRFKDFSRLPTRSVRHNPFARP
jgi:quinol monooxygenase YgiN